MLKSYDKPPSTGELVETLKSQMTILAKPADVKASPCSLTKKGQSESHCARAESKF